MATDAVYLSRANQKAIQKIQDRNQKILRSGSFELDTLYILEEPSFSTAQKVVDPLVSFAGTVDGFHVIAPGWYGKMKE